MIFKMWIHFLLFLLGISPNGFEGFEDEGILVELENFLQISAQNQQGEEILARQKRQNELELTTEIAGTSTNAPLAKLIEKPPNLVEGNEIGLELAEMGGQNSSNDGGKDEFAIGNEEDGDLLTMIWRSDWIWKEEIEGRLRGNGTELGGWTEGKNGTFFGGELANGTESTTERTMKTTTTAFWRKRIRKKGHFDFEAKNSTVWPLAWLNLPATNSPPPSPPIRHSSTNAFSSQSAPIPFPPSTSPTTKMTTNSSKTTPKANRQLCCPPGGLWANWTQIGQCDDNCGGCGQQIFQRECLSSAWGCPCTGESTVQRECAFAPCPFPRLSCCNGRRINSTGESRQANCGPPSVPPANSPSPLPDCLCCPNGGVWGEWKTVGECSDNCGSCGTQQFNRQCVSLAWGCPCSGPVILKLVCNQRPCTFPRLSCCNRLKVKASANRTLICGPEVKMPTTEGGGGIHQLDCN